MYADEIPPYTPPTEDDLAHIERDLSKWAMALFIISIGASVLGIDALLLLHALK